MQKSLEEWFGDNVKMKYKIIELSNPIVKLAEEFLSKEQFSKAIACYTASLNLRTIIGKESIKHFENISKFQTQYFF